jgi:hypothetical protein
LSTPISSSVSSGLLKSEERYRGRACATASSDPRSKMQVVMLRSGALGLSRLGAATVAEYAL